MAQQKKSNNEEQAAASAVEEVKPNMPVGVFEGDEGEGTDFSADEVSLPFILILQDLSPQVKKTEPEYIKGAEAGMFCNTVTEEFGETLQVVPCKYQKAYVEWKPRSEGGGFIGQHGPEIIEQCSITEKGEYVLPNGNLIVLTAYYYVLVVKEDNVFEPAILALKGTQLKKSRKWNATMQNVKMRKADGTLFTPAIFSHIYQLSTVPERNEKGSWFGIKVETIGPVEQVELYQTAKAFKEIIEKGTAKVNHDSEGVSSNSDDLPY